MGANYSSWLMQTTPNLMGNLHLHAANAVMADGRTRKRLTWYRLPLKDAIAVEEAPGVEVFGFAAHRGRNEDLSDEFSIILGRRPEGSRRRIHAELVLRNRVLHFGDDRLPVVYQLRVAAEMCDVLTAAQLLESDEAEQIKSDFTMHADALIDNRPFPPETPPRLPLSEILQFGEAV